MAGRVLAVWTVPLLPSSWSSLSLSELSPPQPPSKPRSLSLARQAGGKFSEGEKSTQGMSATATGRAAEASQALIHLQTRGQPEGSRRSSCPRRGPVRTGGHPGAALPSQLGIHLLARHTGLWGVGLLSQPSSNPDQEHLGALGSFRNQPWPSQTSSSSKGSGWAVPPRTFPWSCAWTSLPSCPFP